MLIQQISMFLENRVGQLAEVTALLAENDVNLRAINIAEAMDYGVLRMIVDDTRKAAYVLSENDCVVMLAPVVVVAVPDRPGGLNEILRVIDKNQIDVEYMYSVFGKHGDMAYMVFRVSEPEGLIQVLQENGIAIAEGEELGIR